MGLFDGKLKDVFNKVSEEVQKADLPGTASKAAEGLGSFLNGVKDAVADAMEKVETEEEPVKESFEQPASEKAGIYWGDKRPKEENQYNYNGTYVEYFDHVFKEDFPQYKVEHDIIRDGRAATFLFYDSTGKWVLGVEVIPRTSTSKSFLKTCQEAGVPHLRFYYNHHGWWNAREYVTARVRGALGI